MYFIVYSYFRAPWDCPKSGTIVRTKISELKKCFFGIATYNIWYGSVCIRLAENVLVKIHGIQDNGFEITWSACVSHTPWSETLSQK